MIYDKDALKNCLNKIKKQIDINRGDLLKLHKLAKDENKKQYSSNFSSDENNKFSKTYPPSCSNIYDTENFNFPSNCLKTVIRTPEILLGPSPSYSY